MTDLQALLAGIIAEPAENTPRLMYADALLERGNAEDIAHAEYIKKAVELDNWRRSGTFKTHTDGNNKSFEIVYSLDYIGPGAYYKRGMQLRDELNALWADGNLSVHPHFKYLDSISYECDRGFVAEVTTTYATFKSIEYVLLSGDHAHPICSVSIIHAVPKVHADELRAMYPNIKFVVNVISDNLFVSIEHGGAVLRMEAAEPIKRGDWVTADKDGKCVVHKSGTSAALGRAVSDSYNA